MEKDDFSAIGEEIKTSVQDAISNGDFSQLNAQIRDSVNDALDELKHSFGTMGADLRSQWDQAKRNSGSGPGGQSRSQGSGFGPRAGSAFDGRQEDGMGQAGDSVGSGRWTTWNREAPPPAAAQRQRTAASVRTGSGTSVVRPNTRLRSLPVRPVGKVSGILFTVFGSILFAVGLILLIVFGSIGAAADGFSVMLKLALTIGLPLGLGGLAMLSTGRIRSGRLSRMNSYVKLTGEKGYCTLKELADRTGRSVRYVVKDLRRMMRMGMLPEAHLDKQKTCFILDNKTHQLYLDMMKSREELEVQEEKTEEEKKEMQEREEGNQVVEEGRTYINQIRLANAALPGEEISEKLNFLSMIMEKIFLYIERHPEKVEEIHKFMDYYLPITLKLVNAYREFDAQPVQGENIRTAKKEIEGTLDTINEAFARLFDNLFADAAMDISTDIDVLETMFAQEGLTDRPFAK